MPRGSLWTEGGRLTKNSSHISQKSTIFLPLASDRLPKPLKMFKTHFRFKTVTTFLWLLQVFVVTECRQADSTSGLWGVASPATSPSRAPTEATPEPKKRKKTKKKRKLQPNPLTETHGYMPVESSGSTDPKSTSQRDRVTKKRRRGSADASTGHDDTVRSTNKKHATKKKRVKRVVKGPRQPRLEDGSVDIPTAERELKKNGGKEPTVDTTNDTNEKAASMTTRKRKKKKKKSKKILLTGDSRGSIETGTTDVRPSDKKDNTEHVSDRPSDGGKVGISTLVHENGAEQPNLPKLVDGLQADLSEIQPFQTTSEHSDEGDENASGTDSGVLTPKQSRNVTSAVEIVSDTNHVKVHTVPDEDLEEESETDTTNAIFGKVDSSSSTDGEVSKTPDEAVAPPADSQEDISGASFDSRAEISTLESEEDARKAEVEETNSSVVPIEDMVVVSQETTRAESTNTSKTDFENEAVSVEVQASPEPFTGDSSPIEGVALGASMTETDVATWAAPADEHSLNATSTVAEESSESSSSDEETTPDASNETMVNSSADAITTADNETSTEQGKADNSSDSAYGSSSDSEGMEDATVPAPESVTKDDSNTQDESAATSSVAKKQSDTNAKSDQTSFDMSTESAETRDDTGDGNLRTKMGNETLSQSSEEQKVFLSNRPAVLPKLDLESLAKEADSNEDIHVSIVTWNLAEESPEESDTKFIRAFRKHGLDKKGSDFVLISGQECENIKPRRTEGRRSREFRRLIVKQLGKRYVPIAIHQLGGIQFCLFCRRSILGDVESVSVADVTCGIGNVFHNKGAIAAFVQLRARNGSHSGQAKSKSLKMLFVTAHLAAHVKNFEARDSDYWRIMTELEAQAPPMFVTPAIGDTASGGSHLFDAADRIFFCGDLNYRMDLPREYAEFTVQEIEKHSGRNDDNSAVSASKLRQKLLRHDQLRRAIAAKRAFTGLAEGEIKFSPTFKYDKHSDEFDTSHKQRIPAWTDRILFKPVGTRVLEYDSVPEARHSDHRPVFATFRVNAEGRPQPKVTRKKRSRAKPGSKATEKVKQD